ncbi:GNAT family N-acetyltransferase [Dongia deserti]|uniref:GNAT family N-acetyltransferase n=1 Tax=Dongia deserti TaxID=2268030 RepID=UPI000E64B434|nr:GNAT family N-acetyltransferase [Dongia deserti]
MNTETPIEPFVRPAIPDDAEGIAKVHVKGWQEAYVGQLPQHVLDRQSVPTRLRMWAGLLKDPPGSRWTFVAIDPAAGIVGFVGGVRARPVMFGPAFKVPVLYVLQSHLRRGLGRKLMHALGDAMARHGAGEVALWSLASNGSARSFYERIGARLSSVLVETDRDGRLVLAGYRWRSAADLAAKSGSEHD